MEQLYRDINSDSDEDKLPTYQSLSWMRTGRKLALVTGSVSIDMPMGWCVGASTRRRADASTHQHADALTSVDMSTCRPYTLTQQVRKVGLCLRRPMKNKKTFLSFILEF